MVASNNVQKFEKEEKLVYTKCKHFPRWKLTPIHDDIDEVTRSFIKLKLLVPPPKPITHPSFPIGVQIR